VTTSPPEKVGHGTRGGTAPLAADPAPAAAIDARLDAASGRDAARLLTALADREAKLRQLEDEVCRLHAASAARFQDRAIIRAARRLSRIVDRLAPEGSRRQGGLRQVGQGALRIAEWRARRRPVVTAPPEVVARAARARAQYANWLRLYEPDAAGVLRFRDENARWRYRPLISVIVPVYDAQKSWLEELVASVRGQAYENWELCLVDDCSKGLWVRPTLERLAAGDPRIQVHFRDANGGIANASNTALATATGEFVALLDHDDVLRPHALHEVVAALQETPELDVLYSDEDKLMLDGTRGDASFKGGFDPDHLLSTNYICHLSVIRRSLLTAIGGFRTGLDGSQDHDLLLRATEAASTIRHIPSVLYSWRQVPGSAALSVDNKPRAWEHGRQAVADALVRRGISGRADFGEHPGLYDVRLDIPASVRVALIVHGCSAATAAATVAALRVRTGHSPVHILVTGQDPHLASLRRDDVDVLVGSAPERRAALLNAAVARVDADVAVFVQADFRPSRSDRTWMAPLVEQALRPEVGVVGGRLVGGGFEVLHEGLRLGRGPVPVSLGVRFPVIQRVAAVSAGLMAVRTQELRDVGGFDERFCLNLWDADLCLRMRQRGLAVVYTPLGELLQHDRDTLNLWVAGDDLEIFRETWGSVESMADPYMSPNLDSISPLVIHLADPRPAALPSPLS
jgi:GT2 family glycosyltransferase